MHVENKESSKIKNHSHHEEKGKRSENTIFTHTQDDDVKGKLSFVR